MQETFVIAAIWLGLAVFATVVANHLRISIALVYILDGEAEITIAGTPVPARQGGWR